MKAKYIKYDELHLGNFVIQGTKDEIDYAVSEIERSSDKKKWSIYCKKIIGKKEKCLAYFPGDSSCEIPNLLKILKNLKVIMFLKDFETNQVFVANSEKETDMLENIFHVFSDKRSNQKLLMLKYYPTENFSNKDLRYSMPEELEFWWK